MLYTATLNGQVPFPRGDLDQLGVPPPEVERILALVARPAPELRAWAGGEDVSLSWEFDHLERFPVLELADGALLAIRPRLLLQRFFGWLPTYDVEDGLRHTGASRASISRFRGCVEHLGEVYAIETITAQARRHTWRTFGGSQLMAALAPNGEHRTCDATVDDGHRWALLEMTASRLTRPSITATSADGLDADLAKLAGKVEQLDQTVAALREREAELTGTPASGRRLYLPVLVTTEGFPVNPATVTMLRERVAATGLLQGDDVAPLEVLDVVELEMLEGAEPGEPTLLDALEDKGRASMALAAMGDYLTMERNLRATVPARVDRLWSVAFALAKAAASAPDTDGGP